MGLTTFLTEREVELFSIEVFILYHGLTRLAPIKVDLKPHVIPITGTIIGPGHRRHGHYNHREEV